jgi:hypothetical protein
MFIILAYHYAENPGGGREEDASVGRDGNIDARGE